MVKKILGYLLSIVGIIGLAMTFPQITLITKTTLPLDNLTLTIISLAILGIGVIILIKNKSSKQKVREVPIYKGKEIVGYRRD